MQKQNVILGITREVGEDGLPTGNGILPKPYRVVRHKWNQTRFTDPKTGQVTKVPKGAEVGVNIYRGLPASLNRYFRAQAKRVALGKRIYPETKEIENVAEA